MMRQWLSPSPSDAPASTGNARDSLPRLMRVDIRWEASDGEHARKMAAELVALSPDVILSSGVTGLTALQKIHHIPVVFAVAPDPVGAGFVDSLARPGGNVTGFMQYWHLADIGLCAAHVCFDPKRTWVGPFPVQV
ncbi:MAG: ABC transporter substrate binding protein [Pseudolabrys sp.]